MRCPEGGARVVARAQSGGDRVAGGCVVDLVDRPPIEGAAVRTPRNAGIDAFVELWTDDEPEVAARRWQQDSGVEVRAAYAVDETVQRDYDRTWAEGEPSPGVKVVYLVERHPDLTVEQFARHWHDVHGPLALRHHVGAWKYVQNVVTSRSGEGADPKLDGVAELHFATVDDLVERMYDTDESVEAIAADVARFIGGARGYLVTEHVVRAPG
jgi:uncharacterized protein (TIGR02118 family)